MIKSLVVVSVLLSTFVFSAPRAEAGLLIGALYGSPAKGTIIGAGIGGAVIGSTIIAMQFNNDPSTEVGLFTGFLLSIPFTVGLTLLDINTSLSNEDLVEGLKIAFPNIDHSEIFFNIAETARVKFERIAHANPSAQQALVQFSREEVLQLVGDADLTSAQLEDFVLALQ